MTYDGFIRVFEMFEEGPKIPSERFKQTMLSVVHDVHLGAIMGVQPGTTCTGISPAGCRFILHVTPFGNVVVAERYKRHTPIPPGPDKRPCDIAKDAFLSGHTQDLEYYAPAVIKRLYPSLTHIATELFMHDSMNYRLGDILRYLKDGM
jgi:hypothetical protein